MNAVIKSEREAREIAKRLFAMRFPDSENFFDSGWELIRSGRIETIDVDDMRTSGDLFVAGTPDALTMAKMKEIDFLLEVFSNLPMLRQELLKKIENVCKKRGEESVYIKNIESRVKIAETEDGQLTVWTSRSTGFGSNVKYYNSETIADFHKSATKYDILIQYETVSVLNRAGKRVELSSDATAGVKYGLLVLLLKYKKMDIRAQEFHEVIWKDPDETGTPRVEQRGIKPKDIVKNFLKSPICLLKNMIQTNIPAFEIESGSSFSYHCVGDFTHCIVLPAIDARAYTIARLG